MEGFQLSTINISQNRWKDKWVCEQLLTGGAGSLRPEVLLQTNLFDQSWPAVYILIPVKYNCIVRYSLVNMIIVTRCPIKPKYFINYYSVIVLVNWQVLGWCLRIILGTLSNNNKRQDDKKRDDDKPEVIFSQWAIVHMLYSSSLKFSVLKWTWVFVLLFLLWSNVLRIWLQIILFDMTLFAQLTDSNIGYSFLFFSYSVDISWVNKGQAL